jgi:hypothetical protein
MSAIYRREGSLCNPSKSRGENGEILGSSRFPVVSDYELWNTIENGGFSKSRYGNAGCRRLGLVALKGQPNPARIFKVA